MPGLLKEVEEWIFFFRGGGWKAALPSVAPSGKGLISRYSRLGSGRQRENPTVREFSWLCFLDQTGEMRASFRETPSSCQKGALGIPGGSGIILISSGFSH